MESKLLYQLHDKPPLWISVLYALQWFFFIFASTLVIPVVVGQAFGLSQIEHAAFIQRTFLVVGIASFLQVMFGHRYPVVEGPAGMWWGIFIILINLASALGKTATEIGQSLELGLIITGIMLAVLGWTGTISKIFKFFSPIITGTYMILLTISLSGPFIKGMLGIGFHGSNTIKWPIAVLSVFLTGFVIYLSTGKKAVLRSFSILIGISAGWLIYAVLGLADKPVMIESSLFTLPELFAFGKPVFDVGVILTSILTGFILISNMITSIAVMGAAAEIEPGSRTFNHGGVFTGVTHMLSGAFATIGMVPLAIAASMVEITGVAAILPFILAALMMIVIGLIPSIGMFFAALPAPVGYAVLFTTFAQLISFGFREYGKIDFNSRNLTIIGLSLMLGTGVMFIPREVLTTVHPIFSYFLGNGLILGVLFSMFLEHIVYRKK